VGKLSRQGRGWTYAVVSASCWGTYGIFLALLTAAGVRQMTLVALVPLVMLVYAFLKAKTNSRDVLRIPLKYLFFMVLHGLLLIDFGNYCYVRAVAAVPVGIVSVISFCNVIIVMFASRIFFHYRLSGTKIGAVLAALAGIAMILQVSGGTGLALAGIGWALALPLTAGISIVLYRYYLNRGLHEDGIVFWINFSAAAVLWLRLPPWAIVADLSRVVLHAPAPLQVGLLLLGFFLIPLAASNFAFFRAYLYIEPTYVSLCYALDPATAAVLGFFLFGQRLTLLQLMGICIVVAAIVTIRVREAREEKVQLLDRVSH